MAWIGQDVKDLAQAAAVSAAAPYTGPWVELAEAEDYMASIGIASITGGGTGTVFIECDDGIAYGQVGTAGTFATFTTNGTKGPIGLRLAGRPGGRRIRIRGSMTVGSYTISLAQVTEVRENDPFWPAQAQV